MRCALLLICPLACLAQDLRQDLSAGFRYEVRVGQNSYNLNAAPGYSVGYGFRPVHWLAIEAGMEQIPRPLGASVCCEYARNADDELFLIHFGARYVWQPGGRRFRFSVGGGGAYLNHTIGQPLSQLSGASGWGAQGVAAGDYQLTRSGRFRAGLNVRYYYIVIPPFWTGKLLTVGPQFTFSFH